MRMARTAGALWLVCIVAGMYAELFIRGSMIVSGNAAATTANIAAAQPMFRIGFVADLIGAMAYLGVTILLYALLKRVDRVLALVMLGFGVTGCAVMIANLINLFAPLVLVRGAGSPDALSATAPLVLAFLRLHGLGYSISIALFSIQVAALGWLIVRSPFLPSFLGALCLLEAVCNLVGSFGGFLAIGWVQGLGSLLLLPGLPAEGGCALWLLVIGINSKRWAAINAS